MVKVAFNFIQETATLTTLIHDWVTFWRAQL